MRSVKSPHLLLGVLLLVCCLVSDGMTQQEAVVDPFQFPVLTNRKAFQRWWWAFSQRAYPLGEIPAGAQLRAMQQIEQAQASVPPTAQVVQGTQWVTIGPAPLSGGQIGQTGGTRPMSGRVADIAVDPGDASHWLIAGAQGGLWETRDAGTTWSAKTDAQASLAMGAIAFAPSNPTIIYAGTGEGEFSGDAYAGAGLLKSTDGGTTWQLLAMATFAKTALSDLKVHPTNPNMVLAATVSGIA